MLGVKAGADPQPPQKSMDSNSGHQPFQGLARPTLVFLGLSSPIHSMQACTPAELVSCSNLHGKGAVGRPVSIDSSLARVTKQGILVERLDVLHGMTTGNQESYFNTTFVTRF